MLAQGVMQTKAGKEVFDLLREANRSKRRFASEVRRVANDRAVALATFGKTARASVKNVLAQVVALSPRWASTLVAVPMRSAQLFSFASGAASKAAHIVSWALHRGAKHTEPRAHTQAGLALEADWAFKIDLIKHAECA